MSFKNLEKRYNENVNKLYGAAKFKYDNGRASRGANDDPLIVRRPGDGYFGGMSRALGRSLPVTSAIQDVKRITLFTLSVRGVTFLLKQQLLQTGNSFEQTRLINPLFAVGAAGAPGLGNVVRIRRHLRPITGGPGGALLGKTDTSYANVKKIGQLQKETYDSWIADKSPVRFLKKIPVIGQTLSAFTAKKNIGEDLGYGAEGWAQTRPELGKKSEDYFVPKMLITPPPSTPISGLFNKLKKSLLGDSAKSGRGGFYFGGKAYTDTFSMQYYGALDDKWNGRYRTYLAQTDGEMKWTHGFLPTTNTLTSGPLERSETAMEGQLSFYWESTKQTELDEQIESEEFYADKFIRDVHTFSPKESIQLPSSAEQYEEIIRSSGILKETDTKENSPSGPAQLIAETGTNSYNVLDQISKYTSATTVFTQNDSSGSLASNSPLSGDVQTFLEYFRSDDIHSIKSRLQADENGSLNARDIANAARSGDDPSAFPKRVISYIKDPSNQLIPGGSGKGLSAYSNIQSSFDDPITVSFAMSADDPIRFRAFITNLQQSSNPEYKTYQYVGRIEKFISYVTVQRDISFKLGLVAFSKDELEGMWARINYLTGLVYPYGWNRGIFQPNIIRLTIGDVYVDQPGYITSLNVNFNQITETWDIDKEVPISAEMDMKFVLIEKKTKTAGSPFYGITENISNVFSNDVTTPSTIPTNPTTQPPVANDSTGSAVLVEQRSVSPIGLKPAKIESPFTPKTQIPLPPAPLAPPPILNPANFKNLIPGG